MRRGLSIDEDAPPHLAGFEAVEFRLHPGNMGERRADIARQLRDRFQYVSAHLPSFLPAEQLEQELAFADARQLGHFVAHVTRRSRASDWRGAWSDYARAAQTAGCRLLFENHNQDWHATDAGLCWPSEFRAIADAGHWICLDLGHLLYAAGGQWSVADRAFSEFLEMPIRAAHLHTVAYPGGPDHSLTGLDIGPWVKRLVQRHPDVVLLVEVMGGYSVTGRAAALEAWLA